MVDKFLEASPNVGLDGFLLLLVLVALEAVLSADNAIALASISKGLEDANAQQKALNLGLIIAFVLRISLILTATWVIQYWQFELLGALYLLWLVYQHFTSNTDSEGEDQGPRFASVWQAIPMIAFTDLAFSLDSVTTAIAVSDNTFIVVTGASIGIIALRFMAGLFIRWLDEFVHLESAGYITVGFVGLRLLVKVINPYLVPPQWLLVSSIVLMFVWGFSKRTPEPVEMAKSLEIALNQPDSEVAVPESQGQKSEI
jgi:YkoY family integral membrane protein